eukprot:COSAG01_NODE_2607_length_7390_cov_77.965574_6_plen_121_part_00
MAERASRCVSADAEAVFGRVVRRVASRWRAQVQWLYGGSVLVRDGALVLGVVAASSGYLWVTDSIAISDGIWWISERYTTGHELPLLPSVPIEEATFFVVTNLMCVQGVHLFLDGLVQFR